MTPVLSTRNLGKTFKAPSGPVPVLKGISLEFFPGTFTVLTGPSGSGKTTFLHLIGFLLSPTDGTILVDGQPRASHHEPQRASFRRHELGMVFQHSALLPRRNVIQNVMFRNRYRKQPRSKTRAEAMTALEEVGMSEMATRKANVLSGGEAQRVALARALMGGPRILLADEPTGNLDADNATRIVTLLRKAADQGACVIMVTHHAPWQEFADHTYRFSQGNVEPVL